MSIGIARQRFFGCLIAGAGCKDSRVPEAGACQRWVDGFRSQTARQLWCILTLFGAVSDIARLVHICSNPEYFLVIIN